MPSIRILPEILSNQIAAGEVVERPASVVKELVENALDAGGTRIQVTVEKGGRRLIQVTDNGSGMSRDDALMSIERYATSKLRAPEDLFAIRTLGFRGEALPSIAAVSRMTIETRETDADAGTEVRIEGGTLRDVRDAGIPPGTRIAVRQLFFNTPARRKFLKAVATEMGHIGDTLAAMALAHPGVAFRLEHDGRAVRRWPAVADPLVRAADVLGGAVHAQLRPVGHEAEHLSVEGWVALPAETRATSRGIFFFVNGRPVRDRTLQHALMAGFGQRLMKGRFPVAALFVRVPFDRVDVNVHPTKHEVRFAEARAVHDTLAVAVSRALAGADRTRWTPDPGAARFDGVGTGEPLSGYAPRTPPPDSDRFEVPIPIRSGRPSAPPAPSFGPRPKGRDIDAPQDAPRHETQAQEGLWPADRFADLQVLGQLHGTYLLCQSETGLVLVDQHAAHERVRYERLRRRAGEERAPAQVLLMPETVELGFREAEALERLVDGLAAGGLEIEPFGGATFAVKTVPPFLAGQPVGDLVRQIAEKAVETGFGGGLDAVVDDALKLVACHGAVRGRQRLSPEQARALLAQLDACANPSHCPHGRPTWVCFSLRELERRFGRIVPH